ncbi:hypothetical protein Q3G72_032729 [Acer saccharum]|nr:hypothetical protein Q3G72_032729 [Acer saccharum]
MQILPTAQKAIYLEGKQREIVTEEVCEQMKLLEKELDGKNFFGGDGIGFVDIVGNVVAFWFRMTREHLGVEVCSPEKFPGLSRWIGNLQEIDVVNECMPPVEKLLAYARARIEAIKYAPE